MNIRKLTSVSIFALFNILTAAAPIDDLAGLTPENVEVRSRTPGSPAETLESMGTGMGDTRERVAAMQLAQVVPEGTVVTWGARPPTLAQRASHCLAGTGRFFYKHSGKITAAAVVGVACTITWGTTTIIYEDEHQPEKLSHECLDSLKSTFNGTMYLTKDVAFRLAETGDEILQYFCGFARTDMGNVLCCESKGGPVVPSTLGSVFLNTIGHAWDCYATLEENWQRFLGYERY